jgi:hypothetical protein
MNCELGSMWKEGVILHFWYLYCPRICVKKLRKPTQILKLAGFHTIAKTRILKQKFE